MSRLKKFNICVIIINGVLLLTFGILFSVISSLGNKYSSDSAKKAWDGSKYTYSQVSLYLSPSNGLDELGVYSLRQAIEKKLDESSVLDAEDNPDGRIWIDSASGEAPLTLSGKMGSCEVTATGTLGDYFIFHPEEIMYGSYYTTEDINYDRVVLDKYASWQLFGSMDTVGMPIDAGSKVFYVAAVVDAPDDGRDKTAYGKNPRIYMPSRSLKELCPDLTLTAYEVCMPNIVKDYAATVMTEVNPAPEQYSAVVDQSGRFDLIKLFKGFGKIPESVMISTNLSYPWFENRTRSAEIIAKILAGPAVYLLIIPAISSVYGLFMLAKLAGKGMRTVKQKADEKYQKKISEIYFQKHDKKHE